MSIACWTLLVFFIAIVAAQHCEEFEGVRQSPININVLTVLPVLAPRFKWSTGYYQVAHSMSLLNNGETLKLSVTQEEPLQISSGVLELPYEFQQLHFHWGNHSKWGSEHLINGHAYPLEMHAVHSQDDTNGADTFVVVTYFFRTSIRDNKALRNILDVAVEAAGNPNVPINVKPFALAELMYTGPFSYYTYEGSLTTPPYTESVKWILAANALPISEKQLKILREAANIDEELKNNFRCIQKLNQRQIHYVIQ